MIKRSFTSGVLQGSGLLGFTVVDGALIKPNHGCFPAACDCCEPLGLVSVRELYEVSPRSSGSGLSSRMASDSGAGDDSVKRAMLDRSFCALNSARILGTSRSAAREFRIRMAIEFDRRKSMISRFISSFETLVLIS